MLMETIKINREKIAFHGELNFIDDELSKDDCQEMVYRLLSWKLGPVEPTRHFEVSYNHDKNRVEVEVFVSITKPEAGHLDTVNYIFSKLMEFATIYQREFEDITSLN